MMGSLLAITCTSIIIYRSQFQPPILSNAVRKELEISSNQIAFANDNSTNTNKLSRSKSSASVFQPNEICSIVSSTTHTGQESSFTATKLWSTHLPQIINASKNPHMPELLTPEQDAELHNLLTTILPPSRMRRSVVNLPTAAESQRGSVRNVMSILEKRIQDPGNNPPLRIAVFGGSVTIGRGCYGRGMSNHNCAWPKRYELLINQLAGQDLIKVYNLGVGGTGSSVGTNMVKYWMYPNEELKKAGPDVVINSYSTNDSMPPWDKRDDLDETQRNLPLLPPGKVHDMVTLVMDAARTSLQKFIRAALSSKQCDVPPLVVSVDDYVGPQQDSFLGDMSYNMAMVQLARWYDTTAISYGDLVRDLAWLENDGRFYNPEDVHYGHLAHQTIAWALGFASLELLSNYCDDEHLHRVSSSTTDASRGEGGSIHSDVKEKNHLYLPPQLTRDFMKSNASKEFSNALQSSQRSYVNLNCSSSTTTNANDVKDRNPCIASWISTPGGFRAGQIDAFMSAHSKESGVIVNGWKTENQMAEGWGNKVGYIANLPGATFTLQFTNVEKDINMVTLFYLRSYGEKWKDSLVKFNVSRKSDSDSDNGSDDVLSEVNIAGVSDDEHSLTLSQEITLSETIRKGETMKIKVELIGGTTFKIMGLMICNST
eukprot:CAMPEP_0181115994 /NCGR_PEP_ID=MMETSP1071-20121207/21718_1 /TAXON_ID=35127 /ORGANISM="Thalassiosira sp., Strain NH16" /LENGTH=655 /DNA_ID=CAMNT_0023200217 /DNA_START=129 /DNA_END=2096 /DNA_ORIENTATION=+